MAGIIKKCEGCEYELTVKSEKSGKPYTRCLSADCPAFIARSQGYCLKKANAEGFYPRRTAISPPQSQPRAITPRRVSDVLPKEEPKEKSWVKEQKPKKKKVEEDGRLAVLDRLAGKL